MGRTVYWMNTSVDGFIERVGDDGGGGSWLRIGEEIHEDFNRRAAQLTLAIEGRVVYEMMEQYDAMDQLAELRATTPGDIGVGGASIATQLLERGLLDELLLYVHPAILGQGRPLFDLPIDLVELDLIELQEQPDSVVLHRYSVRGAR